MLDFSNEEFRIKFTLMFWDKTVKCTMKIYCNLNPQHKEIYTYTESKQQKNDLISKH